MRTYQDIDTFSDLVNERGYEVVVPQGWSGYVVAYDYRGRAVARCFVVFA